MAGLPIFYGQAIKPKQELLVDLEYDEIVHLTQFALGEGAKDGERVMVLVEKDEDTPLVLGTLTRGVCDQFKTDLMVGGGDLIRFSHTGKKCAVHVMGFKQEDIFDSDDEDGDDFEMEEMFDGEPTEEEEKKLRASLKKKMMEDPDISSDDDDDSDDNMDFDEDDLSDSTDDDNDDDDDDDSDSDSDDELYKTPEMIPNPGYDDSEDSDDSASDPTDSDSDSEDSDSSDEEDKLKKQKGRKRADSTPTTPNKRAKASDSAPSSAASTPGRTPVLGDANTYETELVNFLRTNGSTSMAIIGTRVKKPSGVPKLGQFIETRPTIFKKMGDKIGLA
ncbi:NPL domain-containing protein [Chloropicon primus]|uniref:Nucleoplasmin-like domain-containing protein n=1 Tax=Chloropicon primus TaxID=1764295 RepID=A0A5B8MIL8_9CHLO|nr:hypothetical protein A3770_04p28110 [Chloropicon primus]UPQ99503.1 NPL domain-containing protein [Chloropicon primus]|eukprot:QDZ20293.1 hypothetical protein A3770_04p28110 [Chloropicon primus]